MNQQSSLQLWGWLVSLLLLLLISGLIVSPHAITGSDQLTQGRPHIVAHIVFNGFIFFDVSIVVYHHKFMFDAHHLSQSTFLEVAYAITWAY